MDQKMEDINHINDDLKVKLNTKSSEMMKISEENKLLKEKTDSQFNEILSLKSQLSSMYLPTQQQNEQQFANGSFNNEGKSNKPTALFIGTSNTDRINENKLSTAVDITKTTAYTLDEAYEVISTAQCRPDVVIIHSLTNDVKNNNPNECMDKLQMVVESISSKWKEAKTIVSLTTPRLDNRLHRLNSEIIDGLVKRKYLDNKDVYVSDNSNMWHGQVSIQQLLNEDKFHLSERGTSMLASNIKNALHTVLGIKVQQRNNRYSRSTDRARQQYRPQHRQSFNNYHDHNEQNRVKFKRTG
ncbi:unnamed protein product [Mytilus edulis]|uniref:SGNH hydrolase-type esterase domain-containing protein n=1 Tax=Mytilus edulis TaxID=6550 RepID=A0A8S3VJM4_MYTED|nr:unnamed protein product [Mytilus edulis]